MEGSPHLSQIANSLLTCPSSSCRWNITSLVSFHWLTAGSFFCSDSRSIRALQWLFSCYSTSGQIVPRCSYFQKRNLPGFLQRLPDTVWVFDESAIHAVTPKSERVKPGGKTFFKNLGTQRKVSLTQRPNGVMAPTSPVSRVPSSPLLHFPPPSWASYPGLLQPLSSSFTSSSRNLTN